MNGNPIMKGLRIVLGLFLIGYALNQFFHFLPTGYGQMPEYARDFIDAVVVYLPYLYILEIIIGLMLVFGIWTSFIVIALLPLSICFMIFSYTNADFGETWPAIVVALLNIILIIDRRKKYLPLFD